MQTLRVAAVSMNSELDKHEQTMQHIAEFCERAAADGAASGGGGAEYGGVGVALLEDGEQVGEAVQLDDRGGEVFGLVCGLDLGDEAVGLYLKDLGQVA